MFILSYNNVISYLQVVAPFAVKQEVTKMFPLASKHTLITEPLASEWTLSYATPQCMGILLSFYIIQVM